VSSDGLVINDTLRRFAPSWRWPLLLAAFALAPGLARADDWVYTAREGDTLSGLAGTYTQWRGYWREMQVLNHIADPRKLPTGSKIRIPVDWLRFEPAPARVMQTHGDCEVLPANTDTPQPAQEGMALHGGDRVRTGPEGNMSLAFADGSTLLVRAGSLLALDSLSLFRPGTLVDMRLRLQQGAVDSKVVPAPAGIAPRFRIVTPAAVAAVRGTDFRVGAATEGSEGMRNETLKGSVEVAGAGGRRAVPAGFGVAAQANQAPPATRKLLAPPDLAGLPAVVEALPVAFAWPHRSDETAYRAQIAPNARFETLLADRRSPVADAELGSLPDGDYALRVRGIDAAGLEGFDAIHAFKVNARPEPPYAVAPEEAGEVPTGRPRFLWAIPDEAQRYHLQLSSSADFTRPLRDFPAIIATSLDLDQELPPGRYFWRIASIDAQGDHGPYGEVHAFIVKPPQAP